MTMTQELVARSIVQSKGRVRAATLALVALVVLLVALELCLGSTNYDIPTVASVLVGHNVRGATYAIWQVRVPRIIAAVLAGIAFGIGGNTFQTVLGNPLASPDVIGISSGASTVAVIAIMALACVRSRPWPLLGVSASLLRSSACRSLEGSQRASWSS